MKTRVFVSLAALAVLGLVGFVSIPWVAVVCAQSGCPVEGTPRSWGKDKTVHYNISGLSDVGGGDSPRSQARRAFEKWHKANQGNGSGVRFEEVTSGPADFNVSAQNVPNKRAATTFPPTSGATNEATLGATTKLSLSDTNFFDSAQTGFNTAIEKAMLHEIGHSMGLRSPTEESCEDQADGASVMNCASGVNDQLNKTALDIQGCDQNKVSTIYSGFFAPKRDDDGDGVPYGEDCNDERSDLQTWEQCAEWDCVHVQGWVWFEGACVQGSPIILPLGEASDLRLTTAAGGVPFDLSCDGAKERVSWTEASSQAAWLVLDRNGNGTIDNGSELFGNLTPQPLGPDRNGFLALAVFDSSTQGGNGDGWIDIADQVFNSLKLWRDANHDGISQPEELTGLSGAGVSRLSLEYRLASRRDRAGNLFRYRAAVEGTRTPWAYDVFLKVLR